MSGSYAQRFPVPPWRYRLAKVAEWRVGSFNTQNVANTAWAFAQAGQLDTQLFMVLARVVEWREGSFPTQDLANTAWAFARASQLGTQPFMVLARVA